MARIDGQNVTNTPGIGHWVSISNSHSSPITVIIEPWTVEFEIFRGEVWYVFLSENEGELPTLDFGNSIISLFASFAVVYRGTEKVYDFHPFSIDPPNILTP